MKTLITCHSNADFDAFASMIAVRHLYDDCILYYPGSQERGIQKIYSELDLDSFNFKDAADINWNEIERVIIVDTCQKSRVRHIDRIFDKKGLHIEIWDHHPPNVDDLEAEIKNKLEIGATTSLIVNVLKEKNVHIAPGEATLIGLGIYGDTGSFTYSSTTPDDFMAAAWLLKQGMDVNRINDLAAHELTSLHIHALNRLLESAKKIVINDCAVIIAEVSLEHYLGDFAYLAQKLMEMEKFDVLFAIGAMGDRIQIVARSRNEKIDVGKICSELGGGGHAFAASASLKDKSIVEVRELIVQTLYLQARKGKKAEEFMSSPAIGIEENGTIKEADELMLHFGLKSVPVFKSGTRRCVGIFDAQMASKANLHGLGDAPVEEYMKRRIYTIPPTATIKEVAAIIVGRRQRLVPVERKGEIIGVVSRTDLINVLAEEKYDERDLEYNNGKETNVDKLFREKLPQRVQGMLQIAGELGIELGMPVYVVGGFVRDLFLGRANNDIDLVVEGDGIAFAKALANRLGGRVREHQKFLTSVVLLNNSDKEDRIDVATARLEYYESPAALPIVELSSIKMDLFRRDFSINSLAIRLDCSPYVKLIDFFGGRRDLRDKIIRVLHTLSFVEDPTRCLRAVRFEQRYNFRIGPGTEKLIRNSLSMQMMTKLSSQRIFNEFAHLCNENDPPSCFFRMDEIGIMSAILPHWHLNDMKKDLIIRCREMLSWYRLLYFDEDVKTWFLYFLALTHNLNYPETASSYACLGLPLAKKNHLMHCREHMRSIKNKLKAWQAQNENSPTPMVSELYDLLIPLNIECLIFMMATVSNAYMGKTLSRFITTWRRQKPDINGEDLKRLGLRPGPEFTLILQELLKLKLNGIAPDADKQLELVPAIIKNIATSQN